MSNKTEITDYKGIRMEDLYKPSTSNDNPPIQLTPEQRRQQALNEAAYIKQYNSNPGAAPGSIFNPQSLQAQNTYSNDSNVFGNSKFDRGILVNMNPEQVTNNRYSNQTDIGRLANGIIKGIGTIGTTFVNSTVGLANGILKSFDQHSLSGFWDNATSRTMDEVSQEMERLFPNTYSTTEEGKFFGNWANFLGDKVLKNLGFTIGAYYSGALFTKAAWLPKLIAKFAPRAGAWAGAFEGNLFAAIGEGSIEALNNSNDWYKVQVNRFDEQLRNGEIDQQEYNQLVARAKQDRIKMGNADLLMNIPLLTISNMIEFGKSYTNAMKGVRETADVAFRKGTFQFDKASMLGKTYSLTKNSISEGLEEINQKMVSTWAGNAYEKDTEDFRTSHYSLGNQNDANLLLNTFSKSFIENYSDAQSWHEFGLGFITGALGVPRFRSRTSQEGNKQFPITIEGGILGAVREYKESKQIAEEAASYLNNRYNNDPKFKEAYQKILVDNFYQNKKRQAALDDDEFEFDKAQLSMLIKDIVRFKNAGQLDFYKQQVSTIGDSKEDMEGLMQLMGAQEGSEEFFDEDGNLRVSQEELSQQVSAYKQQVLNLIDNISSTMRTIDRQTKGMLSKEALEEMVWMSIQSDTWRDSINNLSPEVLSEIKGIVNDSKNSIDKRSREVLSTITTSEELQEWLKNRDTNVFKLAKVLKDNSKLSKDKLETLLNNLEYIDKSNKSLSLYESKLELYKRNPSLLLTNIKLDRQKAFDKYNKDVANHMYDVVKNHLSEIIQSPEMLDGLDFENDFIKKEFFDLINKGPKELKEAFEKHREYVNNRRILNDAISHINTSELFEDSSDLVEAISFDYLNGTYTKQEVIDRLESMIKDADGSIKDFLQQLLDNFKKAVTVSNDQTTIPQKPSDEKKSNTPKKEDKPNSSNGIFDLMTEDFSAPDPDAEQSQQEGEEVSPAPENLEIETPQVQEENAAVEEVINDDEEPVSNNTTEETVEVEDNTPVQEPPTTLKEGSPLTNWVATLYDINELSENKKLVEYKSSNPKLVQFLNECKAYDLVDRGGYFFKDKTVHYIAAPKGHAAHGQVLLGVKQSDVSKLINRVVPGAATSIGGENYYIIGCLGCDLNDSNAVNLRNQLIDKVYNEVGNISGLTVSSSKNKVREVQDGRFVTSDDILDIPHDRNRNFRDIIGKEDPNPKFGITDANGEITYHNIPKDLVEKYGISDGNPYSNKSGKVFYFMQNTAGRYQPINIDRLTTKEWVESVADYKDTPLYKKLVETFTTLVNSTDTNAILSAKRELANYVYISGFDIYSTNQLVSLYNKEADKSINLKEGVDTSLPIEEQVEKVLDNFLNSPVNTLIQVKTSLITNKNYTDLLWKSGAFKTDLAHARYYGASISLYNIESNDQLEATEEKVKDKSSYPNVREYDTVNKPIATISMNINNKIHTYSLYSSNEGGEYATENGISTTADEQDLLFFVYDVLNNKYTPNTKGKNGNIYLTTIMNKTMGVEILNDKNKSSRVILLTDEEVDKYKQKGSKEKEEERQSKMMKNIFGDFNADDYKTEDPDINNTTPTSDNTVTSTTTVEDTPSYDSSTQEDTNNTTTVVQDEQTATQIVNKGMPPRLKNRRDKIISKIEQKLKSEQDSKAIKDLNDRLLILNNATSAKELNQVEEHLKNCYDI